MIAVSGPPLVEHASPHPVNETLRRLTDAIGGAGLTLFARIDHAANAQTVGMTMPPAPVLIYGNGKGGTPIMLATPAAALALPLQALMQQRGDKVLLAYHPMAALLHGASVPVAMAAGLEPAQRLLSTALTP